MLILSSSRLCAPWMRNKYQKVLGTNLLDKKLLIIPCASANEEKAGAHLISKNVSHIQQHDENNYGIDDDSILVVDKENIYYV